MTKIMTAYVCCKILLNDFQTCDLDPRKIYFRASASAVKVKGTTAFIKEGLWYSIYDLLIGMMLPSGNDASMVLAENFGRLIIMERARISSISLKDQCESDPYHHDSTRFFVTRFIKRMNLEATKLKL